MLSHTSKGKTLQWATSFSYPNNALSYVRLSSAPRFMYAFSLSNSVAKTYISLSFLIDCQFVKNKTLKYILQLEKLGPSCLDWIVFLYAQLSKLPSQWMSRRKKYLFTILCFCDWTCILPKSYTMEKGHMWWTNAHITHVQKVERPTPPCPYW